MIPEATCDVYKIYYASVNGYAFPPLNKTRETGLAGMCEAGTKE